MAWEGSTRAARLPPDWPQRRAHVLARDRCICHICHQPGADEVDHIERGDDHSYSNLAAIHDWPCHRRKTAAEANAIRHRHTRQRPAEPHPGFAP